MDVQEEKRSIISRIETVSDESLLLTVKNLLDFALGKDEENEELAESLERGIAQSKNDQVTPHKDVMVRFRAKYR